MEMVFTVNVLGNEKVMMDDCSVHCIKRVIKYEEGIPMKYINLVHASYLDRDPSVREFRRGGQYKTILAGLQPMTELEPGQTLDSAVQLACVARYFFARSNASVLEPSNDISGRLWRTKYVRLRFFLHARGVVLAKISRIQKRSLALEDVGNDGDHESVTEDNTEDTGHKIDNENINGDNKDNNGKGKDDKGDGHHGIGAASLVVASKRSKGHTIGDNEDGPSYFPPGWSAVVQAHAIAAEAAGRACGPCRPPKRCRCPL